MCDALHSFLEGKMVPFLLSFFENFLSFLEEKMFLFLLSKSSFVFKRKTGLLLSFLENLLSFLEGKMVVEFSDRKEGEKRQWIPVSKKTYWPPPTSIASWNYDIPTPHSLASDDTSSVHSSSWHRETRYKQCSPRYIKHSSRDFYLKVPSGSRTKSIVQKLIAGRYGRRPFDPITFQENRKRHKSKKESLSEVIERLLQKLTKCKKIKDEIVSPRKRLLDKPRSNNVLVQKRTKPHNAFQAKMKEYDKKTSYSIDSILRKQEDKTVRARSVGTIEQQAGPSSVYSKRMPSPVVARRKQVSSPVPSSLQMPFVSASFDPTLHGYLLANQQELMRVISLQNTQGLFYLLFLGSIHEMIFRAYVVKLALKIHLLLRH